MLGGKQKGYGWLRQWWMGLACEVNRLQLAGKPDPESRERRGFDAETPSLRNNNGAVQVRVRLGGRDHFINRLGRWEDPVAVARAQALSARIWCDAKAGSLDLSLQRYRDSVLRAVGEEMTAELPLEEVLMKRAKMSKSACYEQALLKYHARLTQLAVIR